MDVPLSFGRWLKRRRVELGMTQAELAQRIGYSLVTIRKIESDDLRPSQQVAERMAEHLALRQADRDAFIHFARGEREAARFARVGELPTDTAPPLISTRRRTNLPGPLTRLVGREAEVATVARLLGQDTRLLTLTGVGGVGKTRLGLQVAAEMRHDFADGVFFVNLAPITDPSLVASTIAHTLEVRERGGQSLLDLLKDFLRDKRCLLLLDNFEQVSQAAPLVAELLAAAPQINVLVTSRIRLRVRGEQEFPILPLALPPVDDSRGTGDESQAEHPTRNTEHVSRITHHASHIMDYPSVELFIQRAMNVKPDFGVTDQNAAVIGQICHRLDGLPLAIELAAARVKVLPPQALLQRLDQRLNVLTGGASDLPARQQTLRDAIGWSYELLNDDEKTLFRRLGVFVGGFTLDAAEAICDLRFQIYDLRLEEGKPADSSVVHRPSSIVHVLDGITSLIDKSLVRQSETANGEARFWMLETIREYACERLAPAESERLRQAHAHYYVAWAEAAEVGLRGPEQTGWLDRLDLERDNLRTALHWAVDHAPDMGIRMCWALWWFWVRHGPYSEGRQWSEALLGRLAVDDQSEQVAKPLAVKGIMAVNQGRSAEGRAALDAALTHFRAAGDRRSLAIALAWLGLAAAQHMDSVTSDAAIEESIGLARQLGDPWELAWALGHSITPASYLGNLASLEARLDESRALFTRVGDRWGVALSYLNHAGLAMTLGDYTATRELGEKCVPAFKLMGDKGSLILVLSFLATATSLDGDHTRGCELAAECLPLATELGAQWETATAYRVLGWAERAQGRPQAAGDYLRQGLALYWKADIVVEAIICLADLASVAALAGDAERAARLASAAQAQRAALDYPLPPYLQQAYELALGSMNLDEHWAWSYAEGQALTLEQAVEYAISDAKGLNDL